MLKGMKFLLRKSRILLFKRSMFTEDSRYKTWNDGGLGCWLRVFHAFAINVILRRYSLPEVPRRRIHNVIANAMSICVAFGNKVMDTRDWHSQQGVPRKYDIDSNVQCGRSMIEMLGVLAIIAVLSVGGLAGYSKALSMYKWNKALDQWRSMISAINSYKSQLQVNKKSVADSEIYIVPILLALDEFPDDMIIPGNKNQVKDAVGNILSIYSHGTGYIGIASFNANNSYVGCQMFLTLGRYYHNMIERIQFFTTTPSENATAVSSGFAGDSVCYKSSTNCLKDLTVSRINELCKDNQVCKQNKKCHYLMYWY